MDFPHGEGLLAFLLPLRLLWFPFLHWHFLWGVFSGALKNTLLWQAMDGLREDQAR